MTFGPLTPRHGPTGVPADHLPPWRNRFVAVDHRGRVTALIASGEEFGALAVSAGPTSTDDGPWNGPANEANLSNDDGASVYRKAYAWVDSSKDADTKAAYSFIHHEVSSDGDVGAANVKACSSTVGILNGGRGVSVKDADWYDDRKGIYNHMTAHLTASGVKKDDLPELDDMALVEARDNAFAAALLTFVGEGRENPAELAAERVVGMAPGLLLDSFGGEPWSHGQFTGTHTHPHSAYGTQGSDSSHSHAHTHSGDASHGHSHSASVMRTTPVHSGEELAAKITQLRQRQAEQPVERIKVKLRDVGGLEVEMAVRWDGEAYDPAKRNSDGSLGGKGMFVSTLPGIHESHGMVAAGADVPQIVDNPGGAWHAILCVEGLRTDEDPGREIMPGACQFPDLPVSLRLQIEDEGGHWGAVTCGRIDTMERTELQGYNAIPATGIFGTNEHGQLAQLLVEEQTQRFISIDPRDCDIEIVEIEISTQTSGIGYYGDCDDDDDDNGVLYEWWVRYTNLTIGAATIVATPALQQAVIAMASVDLPETPIAVATAPPTSVTVTASGEPQLPSHALFEDPVFHVGDPRLVRQADGHYACPLSVDRATRRVFGHIAYWGANHTGLPGQNRKPPHSPTYAYFMTGARRCAEGDVVAVGNLTMGCGHAAVSIRSAETAKAHYQPTSPAHYDGGYGAVQMADVCAGEDDFGIWASGVLCEGVTEDQIRRFESMGMSGDWRMIAGKLHMVACLAVPVPGFPIARQDALVASAEVIDLQAVRAGIDSGSGDVFALVAAGRVRSVPVEERLSQIERTLDTLLRERAEEAVGELLSVL